MRFVEVRKWLQRGVPRVQRTLIATCIGLVVVLLDAWPMLAQSPATRRAEFEVVSVKVHTAADARTMMVAQPGGRFVAVNVTLRFLIRSAFQLQDDQIIGGPAWLTIDRFDIEARSASTPGGPGMELLEMLQSLLSQRFNLTTHREMRELPVFALERVGSGGAASSGLKRTACPDLAVDLSRPSPCANISNGADFLALRGMPFNQFTQYLAPYVNRVLIDRTGLAERYDIDLKWAPETQGSAVELPPRADRDRPSLFTAMEEQLGVKVVPGREVVEVLVIDTVERPTSN